MNPKIPFRAATLAAIALSFSTFGSLRAQTAAAPQSPPEAKKTTDTAPQPEVNPAPAAPETKAPERAPAPEAKTAANTPATAANAPAPANDAAAMPAKTEEQLTPTGRPDANAAPAPKADSTVDRAAAAVRVALEDNADLSGYALDVEPQGDHVVVRGTVADADLKRQATEAAFTFSGSVKVDVQVKARQ